MESLILNGEEWMYPLLDLRDELVDGRNIRKNREIFRRHRRFKQTKSEVAEKKAKIEENIEGEREDGSWGAYIPAYRAKILRMVLEAQKEIQETQGETIQLISHQ